VNAGKENRAAAAVVAMVNVRILDFSLQAPGRATQGMRRLHGEVRAITFMAPCADRKMLAVPEVDGTRVAKAQAE
jgi:hypothetical protein